MIQCHIILCGVLKKNLFIYLAVTRMLVPTSESKLPEPLINTERNLTSPTNFTMVNFVKASC